MSRRKNNKLPYKHVNNAICLTIHTLDGSEITPEAKRESENAIWEIAQRYGYVINIATT